MTKYNPRNPCPKCGGLASAQYESAYGYEAIRRKCRRCGYGWSEDTLDSIAARTEPPRPSPEGRTHG